MSSFRRLSAFVGLAVIVFASGIFVASARRAPRPLDDKEEHVDLAQVPGPVQTAAKRYFPSLAGCQATTEKKHGETLFELVGKGEGSMSLSVVLTASGEVVEVEREMPADRLPAAVRAEIEKHHPGATLGVVENVEKHHYEVRLVDARGKESEVECSMTGKVSGGKDEKDEDGEEEDED